ncbi:protein BREVIS RADIX-like [Corylus avellana]|uniref:protein BREVIS RADIX-like n=1 Tax=Corylus avellana TaxID=13451 RepID=UPI00286B27E9|nr:protein BREVIS RADIX-like [Corylus avellana]
MFTCIACSKQGGDEGGEEGGGARGSGTPSTKEAVKSLTAQIKDMALKFSGAYRQCKPCTGSSSYKKGQRPYPDFDAISEGVPYPYLGGASSSSTPAWDFTSGSHHPAGRSDSRFTGVLRGDQTPGGASVSAQSCDVVLEDEEEAKEWMAQVEPGVHITFVSLPNGGNDLKRIRFSREMFNKLQAQRWWGENYDRIMELYNVQRFNRQALHTPPRSEDEQRDSSYSRLGSARESPMGSSLNKEWTPRNYYRPSGSKGYYPSDPVDQGGSYHYNAGSSTFGMGGPKGEASSMDASRTTTSSRDEASVSISNASDLETEWVEQDEPGVYITIRQLADGSRELRRVRFSREMFGEVRAKLWWEENKERIQAQYL